VGVAGLGEVGPITLHQIGELDVRVGKPAGDVAPLGIVPEDIGKFRAVDGALRLLAGNGVGELVFIGWMMGGVVPASLRRGRATQYKIGGPLVCRRSVER